MAVSLLDDEHLEYASSVIIARRFAVWTVLCFFGALPSFLLGALVEADVRAMALGVFVYVLLLTALSCTESFNRLKRDPAWRRAIRIAFRFRVGMTLVFPFGWIVDIMAGIVSITVTRAIGQDYWEFGFDDFTATLIITLTQGALLLTFLVALLFFVHTWVAKTTPAPEHLKGVCVSCGYDLRGGSVSGTCPECGAVTGPPQRGS